MIPARTPPSISVLGSVISSIGAGGGRTGGGGSTEGEGASSTEGEGISSGAEGDGRSA